MLISVIDMGSNTFKLILAEIGNKEFNIIKTEKRGVKLGMEVYSSDKFPEKGFKKAVEALREFQKISANAGATFAGAFATAAMRDAKNGGEFLKMIEDQTGISVNLISGDREAELIARGVMNSMHFQAENFLIMDIGGGSTEFIWINNGVVAWQKSFPLGAYRLIRELQPGDPVTSTEKNKITDLLNCKLKELVDLPLDKIPLVGCSGSFETFSDMISLEISGDADASPDNFVELNSSDLDLLFNRLIRSERQDREKMKGLPEYRLDTIVMGVLLVEWYRNTFHPEKIFASYSSMKEGIIVELMKQA